MDAVQMCGITKRFGDVLANDHIDFNLRQGEIHALLGENGAGKTTLMRILYGLYHSDEGQITIDGKTAQIKSPKDAIQMGVGMVTQHFTLVPTLNVAENLALGDTGGFTLNPLVIQKNVALASQRFGIHVKPEALVRHLSVGEQQRVEILKALYHNARVLILDEPTAVLVPQEVEVLFEALERFRKDGLSVIFISHKLNEVMTVCDRITVLRNGCVVGVVEKSSTTQKELASMMVGHESFGVIRREERSQGAVALQIENLSARNKKGLLALNQISFDVRAGEILGVAGVSGNGQTELSQVLAGTLKPCGGKMWVGGKDLTGATPAQLSYAGVGRIAEDRHASLVADLTVAENIALEYLDEFGKHGILDRSKMQKMAETLISEYQIKAAASDCVRTLSGGNMQKVILARTLSRRPKIVIVSQPTRGLDVGATDYVREKILEQRDRQAAVLLISEDLDEIFALADRIVVIYEGKLMGIMPAHEATKEKLGLLMSGSKITAQNPDLEVESAQI